MKILFSIIVWLQINRTLMLEYCDDSCGQIKENSITIYNTDSDACKTDMPISFIKNNKIIVAFLREFKEIINKSEICPRSILSTIRKKLKNSLDLKENLNDKGFKHETLSENESLLSKFFDDTQDKVYLLIIFIMLSI